MMDGDAAVMPLVAEMDASAPGGGAQPSLALRAPFTLDVLR
jgi:hypothetical protein